MSKRKGTSRPAQTCSLCEKSSDLVEFMVPGHHARTDRRPQIAALFVALGRKRRFRSQPDSIGFQSRAGMTADNVDALTDCVDRNLAVIFDWDADEPLRNHRCDLRGQIESAADLTITYELLRVPAATAGEPSSIFGQCLQLDRPVGEAFEVENGKLDKGPDGFRIAAGAKIRFQLLIGLALEFMECGQMLLDLITGQVFTGDQRGADSQPIRSLNPA